MNILEKTVIEEVIAAVNAINIVPLNRVPSEEDLNTLRENDKLNRDNRMEALKWLNALNSGPVDT